MIETMAPAKRGAQEVLPAEATWGGQCFTPRVDIYETTEELLFCCDLPGVKPQDVELRFENGELSLYGKVYPRPQPAGYLLEEYGVGNFYRSFTVSTEVNPDKIAAEYKYGVLTIHLPKAEKVKPKRITVKAG
jgi:HSP20 family protein